MFKGQRPHSLPQRNEKKIEEKKGYFLLKI